MQALAGLGQHSKALLEAAGKMTGVAVARFAGDIENGAIRLAEQSFGAPHRALPKIAENGLIIDLLEAALELALVQVKAAA